MSFRRSARSQQDLSVQSDSTARSVTSSSTSTGMLQVPGAGDSSTSSRKRTNTLDVPGSSSQPKERKGSWLSTLKRPKRFSFRGGGSSGSSKADTGRENQVHAYVAWINSYLSKLPDCKVVEDLAKDLSDGITLVNLIEAVSGESIDGVDRQPTSQSARRGNTHLVLQFMVGHRIKMHHTNAKDVVDGNLKSIMRLVLALAAHYKPSTQGESIATATSNPRPVTGAAGSQELRQKGQQQAPQYPLYVDQVPVMEDSPRHTRSTSNLQPVGVEAGSDPTLRSHDVALSIKNQAFRRRSDRHSMIQLSPSRSAEVEFTQAPASQAATNGAQGGYTASSSSGQSDPISPMDPHELRILVASPGGRKNVVTPEFNFETPSTGVDRQDGGSMSHFRSRSFTELPSSRVTANRRSGPEMSPVESVSVLSPVREGPQASGRSSQQEQRQVTARELALEGLPATHSASLALSRSTTMPLFGTIPPRQPASRVRSSSPIQPVLSGELLVKHLEMEEDVRLFKESLYELQHSLLTGLPADLASVQDMMDIPDEVVLLQARLDQKNRAIDRLEEQLVNTENERDRLKASEGTVVGGGGGDDVSSSVTSNTLFSVGASPKKASSRSSSPLPQRHSTAGQASDGTAQFLSSTPLLKQKSTSIPDVRDFSTPSASPIASLRSVKDDSEVTKLMMDNVVAQENLHFQLEEKMAEIEALRDEVTHTAADKKSLEFAVEEAEKEVVEKKQTLRLLNNELEERDEEIADLRRQLRTARQNNQSVNGRGDSKDADGEESQRPTGLSLGKVKSPPSGASPDSPLLPSERLQGVGADNPDSLPLSRPPSSLNFERPSPPPYLRGLDLMAYNSVTAALEHLTQIGKCCKLPEEFTKRLHSAHGDLVSALEKMERSAKSPSKRRRSSLQGVSPTKAHSPKPGMGASLTSRHIIGQEAPKPAPVSTTVVYFMDQVETPFKTSIQKNADTLTLRDFKDTVDRPGIFRYHFKTVDPDFGTVKEELALDSDRLPLWEGKVVAWIEEDASIV